MVNDSSLKEGLKKDVCTHELGTLGGALHF